MNAPTKQTAPKPVATPRQPTAMVKLAGIERDAAINCRAGGVSERVAAEYLEALKGGAKFPPVVVFKDCDGQHFLADGFHRCHAVELAGGDAVLAEVREGDRRAALLYAAGANAAHGTRRSRADIRRAIVALLADTEWRAWSDREIATRCAVSPTTVGKLRAQVSKLDSAEGRRGKDGKVRRMPKRKGRSRKANPARALKAIRRGLERVAKSWPEGEPVGPFVEAVRAWLGSLEASGARAPATRAAQ